MREWRCAVRFVPVLTSLSRAALARSTQLCLVLLLAFTGWAQRSCALNGCARASQHAMMTVAILLSVGVYIFNLTEVARIMFAFPRRLEPFLRASLAASKTAVPAAVVGVCALWFGSTSAWTECPSVGWSAVSLGIVHVVGAALTVVSVFFAGNGTDVSPVITVGFSNAVLCVLLVLPVGVGFTICGSQRSRLILLTTRYLVAFIVLMYTLSDDCGPGDGEVNPEREIAIPLGALVLLTDVAVTMYMARSGLESLVEFIKSEATFRTTYVPSKSIGQPVLVGSHEACCELGTRYGSSCG